MEDYFQILGLSTDASTDEIRSAYRKLAKLYHPDVNKSSDASARFIQIQEAYAILSDPVKRSTYLHRAHAPEPAHTRSYSSAQREEIFEEWIRQQQREKLKRKVAEMRRQQREMEEKRDVTWYFFAGVRVFLYAITSLAFFLAMVIPIVLYYSDAQLREEAGSRLIMVSAMGATFVAYLIYNLSVRAKKKH